MNCDKPLRRMPVLPLILGVAFFGYFSSEAILRQFVLHRAGGQSISLNEVLSKLPAVIRDEVKQKITIAELRDKLLAASTDGEKITTSIALAFATDEKKLPETYAAIIDKYPSAPESLPAFVYYLAAPPPALKSISVSRYHEYIKPFHDPDRYYALSSGLAKLKSQKATPEQLMTFLSPLLASVPQYREYQQLYRELAELAFQEDNQEMELKAKKLEDICDKLPSCETRVAPVIKQGGNKK